MSTNQPTNEPNIDLYGLAASRFGDDFAWGTASAAYQIEGAWNLDGKGPSIWDTFTHRERRFVPTVIDGTNADEACDFYHRYESDIATMDTLGFNAHRFSLSWPRVLPEGVGRVNEAGLDFYDRVVDSSLEHGLEPWITLYHWDLPEALHQRGGWTNREIVGWFDEYVELVTKRLGDRVKRWMIFNEPVSFCLGGYLAGASAPGIASLKRFSEAVHNVNLAQASAAHTVREHVSDAIVGTTNFILPVDPQGSSSKHLAAARSIEAIANRIFIEPNMGMGYPEDDSPIIKMIAKQMQPGDDERLKVDFDFLGAQYYSTAKAVPVPLLKGLPRLNASRKTSDRSQLGYAVRPEGLYRALKMMHDYGRFPSIVVTENGMSTPDVVEDGRVYDLRRIDFLRRHLMEVERAKSDGMPIDGYFYWSYMDNFEWAEGFVPRFGLVHVDYETQERTIKDSGYWMRDFLNA